MHELAKGGCGTSVHYSHFSSSLKTASGFLQRLEGTRDSRTLLLERPLRARGDETMG